MTLFTLVLMLTASNYIYYTDVHQLKIAQKSYQEKHKLLLLELQQFSQELYLAAQPYPCTQATEKLLGEHCDLGSYMEWALPQLQQHTQTLLLHLKKED